MGIAPKPGRQRRLLSSVPEEGDAQGRVCRYRADSGAAPMMDFKMRQLSPAGQQIISDIAQRHGFSVDATMSMLDSVINGNGSMAQFNHHEFAGSGQWMRGGMIMVSDMFNNHLKGRVDGLCSELANLIASQPDLIRSGSFQSQSQGGRQPLRQRAAAIELRQRQSAAGRRRLRRRPACSCPEHRTTGGLRTCGIRTAPAHKMASAMPILRRRVGW